MLEYTCAKCEKNFTKIYREGDGFFCWRHLSKQRKMTFLSLDAELKNWKALEAIKERNRAQSGGIIGGYKR